MIISRWISLDAAATFAVSTKVYAMGMQLIANPISVSGPGLTELYVRGEHQRFIQRYWDIIAMILAISTVVATSLAVGNRSFVSVWTHGNIHWHWTGDLILALLLVLRNLNGCLLNLFGITKDWRPVRHIYLAEGMLFVPTAIILATPYGLTGVLLASLLAHLVCTTTLSARAAARIVGSSARIGKNMSASLGLIFVAGGLGWAGVHLSVAPFAMLVATSCLSLFFMTLTWYWVLSESLKGEFRIRIAHIGARLKKS
jgi:O-antigen/teichoic acid export membrane protein